MADPSSMLMASGSSPMSASLNLNDLLPSEQTVGTSGTRSAKKVLSQQAIDQLIYSVLSSDQGLASLASGENLSGGFNSSTKTLQAQDLMTKLVGELAAVTAETVETSTSEQSSKKSGALSKVTVICTELNRQGLLDPQLYALGQAHSETLHPYIYNGYRYWAEHVVKMMQESPTLTFKLLPVVEARYNHISGRRKNFLGALTVHVGEPICFLIGAVLALGDKYGRTKSAT